MIFIYLYHSLSSVFSHLTWYWRGLEKGQKWLVRPCELEVTSCLKNGRWTPKLLIFPLNCLFWSYITAILSSMNYSLNYIIISPCWIGFICFFLAKFLRLTSILLQLLHVSYELYYSHFSQLKVICTFVVGHSIQISLWKLLHFNSKEE